MGRTKKTLLVSGVLAALLSSAPVSSDDLERAIALAAEQRYAQAREALAPVLARDPDAPRARLLHGVLYAREGRLNEAIAIFDGLARDRPDMPEPYNNLAVLYAVQSRYEDARDTLLAAVERHPEFATAYANLGDVYVNLAHRAYRRAHELDPDGAAGVPQGTAMETLVASPGTSLDSAAAAGDAPPGDAAKPLELETALAADAPAPAAEAASPPERFCVRAGGFEDREAAAGAEQWLHARGAEEVVVRREERQVINSHRVYLPPLASREEADAMARELSTRGVRDVAVLGSGDLANGISLGVYRDAKNMRQRVVELERLGYSVRYAPDMQSVREFVVEVRARGAPEALDADWAPRFPEHPLQPAECR